MDLAGLLFCCERQFVHLWFWSLTDQNQNVLRHVILTRAMNALVSFSDKPTGEIIPSTLCRSNFFSNIEIGEGWACSAYSSNNQHLPIFFEDSLVWVFIAVYARSVLREHHLKIFFYPLIRRLALLTKFSCCSLIAHGGLISWGYSLVSKPRNVLPGWGWQRGE